MNSNKSILRAFVGTAGIQLFAKGISLITGIIFARILGPENFGRYAFVISIISLAVLPCVAGLPELIIREVARYRLDKKYSYLNGLLIWSTRYVLAISVISIFFVVVLTYYDTWNEEVSGLVLSAYLLIPIKGLISKQTSVINGFQRPELAQLPLQVVAPVIALCSVSLAYFILEIPLSPLLLIYFQIFTHVCAMVFSVILLKSIFIKPSKQSKPKFEFIRWHKALLPFTLVTVIGTMNTELAVLTLGFFGNEEGIGYFRVAMTGTTVLLLGLQAVNAVSAPRIASMYKQKNLAGTQDLLTQSVRLGAMTSIPMAILFILFGEYLISFLFGESYSTAAHLLSILCLGQIFNVCMGSVGVVLNMTGNEKYTLKAQILTLILTLILLISLIPLYQETGAAIAVSISLVFWNIIMALNVYRLTGLKTWLRY
ncbi:Polysacc_synt_C domain-containing protein [Vibrio chagasii]|nr:Polysacc_synt_C domain-containing protein [Vibrio chagasii]CAH7324610.1 Polysacc_synt_C domain-containing protein [Vibrio chagasii]CAH7364145.1 Polysacc_synt_C domain-containing protein [Vibrio chagasii]CAH7412458.1 Polysacc_synt_C domain-containing protein [Vibrio chagasii]CAH7475930.1 Polysacc_synt_C domain-containing protein [Vibrio chagasii]